eukprot:6097981-Pyramimonas_sp.AAC.2
MGFTVIWMKYLVGITPPKPFARAISLAERQTSAPSCSGRGVDANMNILNRGLLANTASAHNLSTPSGSWVVLWAAGQSVLQDALDILSDGSTDEAHWGVVADCIQHWSIPRFRAHDSMRRMTGGGSDQHRWVVVVTARTC